MNAGGGQMLAPELRETRLGLRQLQEQIVADWVHRGRSERFME